MDLKRNLEKNSDKNKEKNSHPWSTSEHYKK
jgi:hypothetical protein